MYNCNRSLYPGTPRPRAHFEGLSAGHTCHMLAQVRKNQYMTFQLTLNTNDAIKAGTPNGWALYSGLVSILCTESRRTICQAKPMYPSVVNVYQIMP